MATNKKYKMFESATGTAAGILPFLINNYPSLMIVPLWRGREIVIYYYTLWNLFGCTFFSLCDMQLYNVKKERKIKARFIKLNKNITFLSVFNFLLLLFLYCCILVLGIVKFIILFKLFKKTQTISAHFHFHYIILFTELKIHVITTYTSQEHYSISNCKVKLKLVTRA